MNIQLKSSHIAHHRILESQRTGRIPGMLEADELDNVDKFVAINGEDAVEMFEAYARGESVDMDKMTRMMRVLNAQMFFAKKKAEADGLYWGRHFNILEDSRRLYKLS